MPPGPATSRVVAGRSWPASSVVVEAQDSHGPSVMSAAAGNESGALGMPMGTPRGTPSNDRWDTCDTCPRASLTASRAEA